MAHFALLDENNVVQYVTVIGNDILLDENGKENEAQGIAFCQQVIGPGKWIQTSYNHNFRRRYAGTGMTYNEQLDMFIVPCPDNGLILDDNGDWVPPHPAPDNNNAYVWSGEKQDWILFAINDNIEGAQQNLTPGGNDSIEQE